MLLQFLSHGLLKPGENSLTTAGFLFGAPSLTSSHRCVCPALNTRSNTNLQSMTSRQSTAFSNWFHSLLQHAPEQTKVGTVPPNANPCSRSYTKKRGIVVVDIPNSEAKFFSFKLNDKTSSVTKAKQRRPNPPRRAVETKKKHKKQGEKQTPVPSVQSLPSCNDLFQQADQFVATSCQTSVKKQH